MSVFDKGSLNQESKIFIKGCYVHLIFDLFFFQRPSQGLRVGNSLEFAMASFSFLLEGKFVNILIKKKKKKKNCFQFAESLVAIFARYVGLFNAGGFLEHHFSFWYELIWITKNMYLSKLLIILERTVRDSHSAHGA